MEVVRRLDADVAFRLQVDVDGREYLDAERLGAVGDERDLDAADADAGAIAEADLCRAEHLHAVLDETDDLDLGVDRHPRHGRRLAAEAQRKAIAHSRLVAEVDGDRIPERSDASVPAFLLQQDANDVGVVGGGPASRVIGRIGDDDGALGRGISRLDRLFEREHRRIPLSALGPDFLAELARQRVARGLPAIRDDKRARAVLWHVALREAVAERDG